MGSVSAYETASGKRYRVRYRQPDKSQTDKRGFRTKREAELFLASVEVTKSRGEYVSAAKSRITVGETAIEWIDAQAQLKPSTHAGYKAIVRTQIVPKWGTVSLGDLTHSDVQKWISEQSRRVSPSTTRSYHRVLSMVLKFAIRDGRLSRNVCEGIGLPRIVRNRRQYLTHEAVHELAQRCGPDGLVVLFLAYTGLRWGEMAALRIEDIDLERRRVNVNQAVAEIGRDLVYGTPKSHSRRSVPYPKFLQEALEVRTAGRVRGSFVFTAPAGGALRNRNWRRRNFERAVRELATKRSEVSSLSPHDLRHTAASLAISAGANVKAVQRMLGHKSAAMTLDVYSDLFDDDLDAVGMALDKAGSAAFVGKMWANAGDRNRESDENKPGSA
jgi:integrase